MLPHGMSWGKCAPLPLMRACRQTQHARSSPTHTDTYIHTACTYVRPCASAQTPTYAQVCKPLHALSSPRQLKKL